MTDAAAPLADAGDDEDYYYYDDNEVASNTNSGASPPHEARLLRQSGSFADDLHLSDEAEYTYDEYEVEAPHVTYGPRTAA